MGAPRGRGTAGLRRGRAALLAAAAALLLAVPAAAAPPDPGVLVPGQSLGGIRIGMTKAEVRAHWGTSFGLCRSCTRETWYFNYRPFTPQGAGVSFARGRVAHVFTLWQPLGWRSVDGVALGELEAEVGRVHDVLARVSCGRYAALVERGRRAKTAFYVYDGVVWGFGLMRRAASPCL